ncbi:uncharacterized protein M421DRAFT_211971 [Didymella exigua CBS 183.55]|uniref:MARVEL domain-containing protein n=1 Tax=Didymella exigua CBS 183.55 TaxID=1150837 RepID=A0A6A5RE94_9PLEO|nr:uncharacterized protein M421DRAFT_211971 [Didymella exigua CBS 183.55]KAF1926621.1 hypothetical protein M421DRAFT_211971 [Didymella exigua CBS 183.55]
MEKTAAEIILAERRNEKRQSAPEIRDYRLVSWVRLILRVLSMSPCALILVSLIYAIRNYRRTKHVRATFQDGSGSFPVWSKKEGLKMYPTYILLGAAAVAGVLNIVLVLAALTKAVRRTTKVSNISTMVMSSICLALWIAVTSYYGTWDSSETSWDLLSWTCANRDYGHKDVDFGETCTEVRFAFWAGVGLAGLEAVNFAIFVIWWLKTRRTRGYSKV